MTNHTAILFSRYQMSQRRKVYISISISSHRGQLNYLIRGSRRYHYLNGIYKATANTATQNMIGIPRDCKEMRHELIDIQYIISQLHGSVFSDQYFPSYYGPHLIATEQHGIAILKHGLKSALNFGLLRRAPAFRYNSSCWALAHKSLY